MDLFAKYESEILWYTIGYGLNCKVYDILTTYLAIVYKGFLYKVYTRLYVIICLFISKLTTTKPKPLFKMNKSPIYAKTLPCNTIFN